MPNALLWINKNASSGCLSQSAGPKESKIRRHAQQSRWARARQSTPHGNGRRSSSNLPRDLPAKQSGDWVAEEAVVRRQPGTSQSLVRTTKRGSQPEEQRESNATLQNFLRSMPSQLPSVVEINHSLEERRSLHFFKQYTAPDWTGWEDTPLWNDLALQFSHSSPAIRHALVALSAFHESKSSSVDRDRCSSLTALSLKHRDRAITAAGTVRQSSHLEALVSCLTLICVQNVQNGHHSFRLLDVGRRMLDECQSSRLADYERFLVQQYVRPLFNRLSGRLCMMIDPAHALRTSIERRRDLRPLPKLSKPCVPLHFGALKDARDSLDHFFHWAHDSSAVSQETSHALSTIKKIGNEWLSALHRTPPMGDRSIMAGAALLKAAYLFGIILLETFQCESEAVFDQYTDTFAQIIEAVELAQNLIRAGDSQRDCRISFGIDNGLVDIVAFTGQKCRHPRIRRRALAVLTQSGRVEGGRLACTAGVILQALIGKEEGSVHSTTAPPEIAALQRWCVVRGEQYFRLRKIRLILQRATVSEADGNEIEECWVDLPEDIGAVDPNETCEAVSVLDNPGPPDTVFGCGFVSFLENRKRVSYLTIEGGDFFFPIPRA